MNKNFKLSQFKQKGFTLVEVAIVVAIGALLLIGISQAPRIIAGNKSNAEIAEIPQIVTGVQKIYANQATYAGATLTQVIALNGLPPERVSAGAGVNRWGGAITMAVATVTTANDAIALTSVNVPSLECTDIIPSVANRFARVQVNGVDVKSIGAALSLVALGTQCATAAQVPIIYTFTK